MQILIGMEVKFIDLMEMEKGFMNYLTIKTLMEKQFMMQKYLLMKMEMK